MGNLTIKQEKFCQKYLETGNASEAYRLAYDAKNTSPNVISVKASELLKNGKIAVRVDQLKKKTEKRHQITMDDLMKELEEARAFAKKCSQSSTMVSATMSKAKLLGLDKGVTDDDEFVRPTKVVIEVTDGRKPESA